MLMRSLAAIGVLALRSAVVGAQTPVPCDYATCGLGISPRLTALDVVRGDARAPAGSLSFVWPRATLVRAFEGDVRAEPFARRSLRTRRIGAALTDVGVLFVAAAAARLSMHPDDRRWSAGMAGLGVASLAVSVPVQFAADAQLSRAVFEFNRRYAR
jgi:hypothetical protein